MHAGNALWLLRIILVREFSALLPWFEVIWTVVVTLDTCCYHASWHCAQVHAVNGLHSNMFADGAKRLEDEKRLTSYAGIGNGSVLLLLVLPPFELYVQGADGRMHTITVPSSEPEVGLDYSQLCVDMCVLVCTVKFIHMVYPMHHILDVLLPTPCPEV